MEATGKPANGAGRSAPDEPGEAKSGTEDTHPPGPRAEGISLPTLDLPAGEQVGEYVVEEKIGEGAFGAVYRGVQPLIEKRVAIKVLNFMYSADPGIVSRFIAEARAVNKIGHGGIIDIFSFGQLPDGRHYYIMELLEGTALDTRLVEVGRIEPTEAVRILRQVGRALDAAHAAGIAHRDLKPANIFLAKDEDSGSRAKLLDFGVAKLMHDDEPRAHRTGTGVTVGTPAYMSPEQCRGEAVDSRADVYSFGIVAYEMLVGRRPFDTESGASVMVRHIHDQPPPPHELAPDLPEPVSRVVLWMLAKQPEHRPANLAEAVDGLERGLRGERVDVPTEVLTALGRPASMPAGTTGAVAAQPQPGNRRRLVTLAVVACAIAVGVAVGLDEIMRAAKPGAAQPPAISATPIEAPPATDEPAPAVDAPPAMPATVTVEITGLPAHANIRGPDGTTLRTGPGKIELDRGDAEVVLTFEASGHEPNTARLVPNRDKTVTIELAPKARRPPKRTPKRRAPVDRQRRPDDIDPWQ